MTFVQVRVNGDKEIFRFLKKLPYKANQKGMKMTERVADMIVGKAKELVGPFHTGTGDLKDSIQKLPMANGKGFTVVAGRGLKRPYAYYQEYGFAPHVTWVSNLDRRSNLYKVARATRIKAVEVSRHTPFMGPAFNYAMARIDSELNRTANEIIRG